MKAIITIISFGFFLHTSFAQNVGIGTTSPVEKLEVSGGIKIGATNNTAKGTIRWNETKNDFEGYNGTAWVSLTGGKSRWGSQTSYTNENQASHVVLHYNNQPGGSIDFGSYLGESLAMDNGIAVAGARGDYSTNYGFSYSGNVYLFTKSNSGWIYKRIINNPTPTYGESFGNAVDIHNNTIIAGAPNAIVGGENKGEAYIFNYNPANNSTALEATLAALSGMENDDFGRSVSIHENYAMVGAPLKDVSGINNCGSAYIYVKTGSTWSLINTLTPADRAADNFFGFKVSISGSWAAVSAPKATVNGLAQAGKVYLYKKNSSGTSFIYHSTLSDANAIANNQFGSAIELTSDTLAVGAIQRVGNNNDGHGKAYVYIYDGANWQLQQTVTAGDSMAGDGFGCAVSIKNGQLLVGAYSATAVPNEGQGKAYMFSFNGTFWEQEAIFTSSNGARADYFGWAVTTDGTEAIVSALNAALFDSNDNGRLYFFRR